MATPANFKEFLSFLTIPFSHLNFVDVGIILVIVIYIAEGYAIGFIRETADFISFILSFIFALTFYSVFGSLINSYTSLPKGFGNALGFFLAAFLCEVIVTLLLRHYAVPFLLRKAADWDFSVKAERTLGIVPGILSALTLLSFVLTMIVALPLSPFLKNSVASSRLGEPLVSNIQGLDKKLNNVFGGAVNDALTFLTVEPKSEELINLNFQATNLKVDNVSEKKNAFSRK